MRNTPLLFVDVDGVISLWGFPSDERPPGVWCNVGGTAHFLSTEAARHLLDLHEIYELVWCTGWEENADAELPHALGVPRGLAHVRLERTAGRATRAHWKLDAIEEHAAGRPLAWIDDDLDAECEDWARERDAPTLLVRTHPSAGLTAEHAGVLRTFAREAAA